MAMTAGAEVTDDLWSPVLAGVQAEALDCLQANLALIADRYHRIGAHLALGAPLRFTLDDRMDAPAHPPALAATLGHRLAEASELLGLRVTARWDGLDGAGLRQIAADYAALYVVADAYWMAWVPYAGQRHMEHSFLLTKTGQDTMVIDAYHNNTEWGQAKPGIWRIPSTELDGAAAAGATAVALAADPVPELDPAAVLVGNEVAMAAARPAMERYLVALRACQDDALVLDQLVFDVWLLSRARSLHAAWLASLPGRSAEAAIAAEHGRAWQRLTINTFVAARRVHRGQGAPIAAVGQLERLLEEDVTVVHRLAACPHHAAIREGSDDT